MINYLKYITTCNQQNFHKVLCDSFHVPEFMFWLQEKNLKQSSVNFNCYGRVYFRQESENGLFVEYLLMFKEYCINKKFIIQLNIKQRLKVWKLNHIL